MGPGYGRYDSDRRSRSPRGRSQDRFESDRRRSLAEGRGNNPFQSNRDSFAANRDNFGDPIRREPPKGPRAHFDPPSGPRGGFSEGFRGGRGRGRGRGWSSRDDDRDRGRDRDLDFRDRDRFLEDRSRERDRDRDRDRDWDRRDSYRSRRSPPGRGGRSPTRDFRDRDRDGPPGPDADRPRRNSRDGPPIGSPLSEPQFGAPRGRGGFRGRGRGRGGWDHERDRGRPPFDDRGDRYPRSRSQEGRWGPPNRERDERDRNDRFPENEPRRDPRADRDRADLFEKKLGARSATSQEPPSNNRDVSPPPVAPSAPAFGSVPNRGDSQAGKLPPTGPRAFTERHGQEPSGALPGPPKGGMPDSPPIPVGPRAQQQKAQRPSSKQWINPNLKRAPDSPKMMRAQTINQTRPGPPRRESSQMDQPYDSRRPQSSDSKSGHDPMDIDKRRESTHSAEPGEIMSKSDEDVPVKSEPDERRPRASDDPNSLRDVDETDKSARSMKGRIKRPKPHISKTVRFSKPLATQTQPVVEPDSESDDDEDMLDYFNMEIEKTEAELSKLQLPGRPREVVARFASMSHGAMVKILNETDGLEKMVGKMPEGLKIPSAERKAQSPNRLDASLDGTRAPEKSAETKEESTERDEAMAESRLANLELKPEAMQVDETSKTTAPPATAKSESADVTMTEGKAAPTFTSTEKRSGELPAAENILPTVIADQRPLPTTETGSKPPSTPSHVEDEGDDEETESEEEEIEIVDTQVVRKLMSTPPLDDLPHFEVPPWDQEPDFKSMDSDSLLDGYILDHLNKVRLDRTAEQKALQQIYVKKYRGYLDFTQSEDPIAIRSRDKYSVSGPPPPVEVPGPTTPEPTSGREGRGGRRFASERDLERVLQASMREEDERREREMRMQKEKTRSDKEATIPDMYWDAEEKQEQQFQDRSGFVPPERLVSAWEVLPPVNNFTAEENDAFEKTYLQLPKQWGKVAEAIPNRDFGACIQYYYLMKRELNLKDKLKRQPKRRKKGGRGKQRSSALVSELGNGDAEGDENNDTGENGENRRRPRRAAAPTWGFEQPPTESESATPVGTPGRRGAGASKGDQPEKVDGRKTRKRKDKDAKVPKPNQMLAAAPGPGRGRARSEVKGQNIEFQTPLSGDVHRLPTHFEQQPAGMQPPFSVSQPHQQGIQGLDRSQPLGPGSTMADVMAAPSLRPEPPPPPQPAMTTFNLSQPQPERKAPTQASSYWSVSESNDFPGLLRAFGSDWTAIAAHMGSKTAVMVKNYYVRQKEAGRVEWESMIQEADAKRSRGEKRPDPPQPTTTGRGRRYDPSGGGASRPLAAAPGGIELAPESTRPKTEAGPAPGPQGYPAYGVPIAQAPTQPLMGERGQKTIAMQQQPQSQQQHPSVSQAMSPAAPPLRAPPQSFGFEREREREREQSQQRVPLPQQAAGQPHPDVSRPPMHSAPAEPSMELQKREILQQQQQQREREQARARELEAKENQMEREMLRQPDRRAMGLQPEQERPGRQFDAFGRPLYGSRDAPRGDPLSMSRHPQEAPHHGAPQYPPPHSSSQPMRSLLGDHPSAQSPPPLGPPTSRPLSSMQHRQSSGSVTEIRGTSTSQSSTPAPPAAAPRPPEPRKSNIMSLLNDDPPPPPKRVNDVSTQPSSTSATPPPQGLGRPPPGYQPPSHMRRESEQQYPPYGGRPTSAAPTGMPSLKPTYSSPSQPSRSAYAPVDSPGERDFYGRPQYQPGHQSQTNSPQATHQYPTHSSRGPGQPQGGYPSAYGAGQPPSASSPPPQFSLHAPSRPGDPPRGSRESWPPSHQQGPSPGSWGREPPKGSQPPPPQHPWPAPHGSGTPKAGTPTGQWPAAAPPPSQAHPGMRDERGPPMYGSQQQPPPQHQMQSRYAQPPPSSRGPESVPPPAQAYPRYATPGPGAPRDPRDMPPRSYTPASYDGRGPHPAPPGPGYPGADPRNMQLRESRDPRDQQMSEREMIARGLRPPEYGRPGEPYGGR